MKENNLLIDELGDEQIEDLIKYTSHYSDESLSNIKNKVKNKLAVENTQKNKRVKFSKAFAAIAAATAILGIGIVQAKVIDLNDLFQMFFGDKSDYMVQYGEAISESSIYDGIELKLLAAYKDEEDLTVFFTLTDTTEDRLSEQIEFSSHFDFDSTGGSDDLLKYDASLKIATFVSTNNANGIVKENVAFSIKQLRLGEKHIAFLEKNIDVYSILSNYKVNILPEKEKFIKGTGITDMDSKIGVTLLEKGKLNIPFENIDWSYISNIGFVDGKLHIQTNPANDTENVINRIYFVNENGEKVFGDSDTENNKHISFGQYTEDNSDYGEYDEFIFGAITDIEQIKGLTLEIVSREYANLINNADLSVTFKVPDQMPNIIIPIDRKITSVGEIITKGDLVLSPLYLKICYETDDPKMFSNIHDDVYIMYKDGTKVDLTVTTSGKNLVSYDSEVPKYDVIIRFSNSIIEIEKVQSININGQIFTITN